MFVPEELEQHKSPTIVTEYAIAERLDPLDEACLMLEGLFREVSACEEIVIGSSWPDEADAAST